MLKQRLLTALVAIPIVAGILLFTPRGVVAAVLAVMSLIGAWEWTAFIGCRSTGAKSAYSLLTALALVGCALTLTISTIVAGVIIVGVLWWLLALGSVLAHGFGPREALRSMPSWVVGLCGLLTLVPAWEAVVAVRGRVDGAGLLFFLLALIFLTDTGAYAAGRLWGRHRLAPRISPGKTWEGVAGGLVAAVIIGTGGGLFFGFSLGIFIPVCVLTAAFSIVGDLSESLFKRLAGVKDSGNLFPGHGGALDRLDSISAAVPVFYLLLWALGL